MANGKTQFLKPRSLRDHLYSVWRYILLLALLWSVPAFCQTRLTLEQAEAEALHNNPELLIANARVQEMYGAKLQAGLRPNPRVTLQTEDIRPSQPGQPFSFPNSTEDYITVGQVVETGGKRSRRVVVANAGVHATEIEAQLARRRLAAAVSLAFWNAMSAQEVKRLTEQNLKTYDEDVVYSTNRVNQGVSAESDLIRIQIERDRVQASLLAANREVDQTRLELFRVMGRRDLSATELVATTDSLGEPRLPPVEKLLSEAPQIKIANEQLIQAQAELRLQMSNGKPDPEILVGYKRNVGADTAYAALQLDLPIRNRNQGNVASAAARVHEAEANLRLVERNVRVDLYSAQRDYDDERTLLDTLPRTVSQAEESERLARAAYREGALDLLKLLDAERTRIQVQVEYRRARTDLQQRVINLQLASGAPIAGVEQ